MAVKQAHDVVREAREFEKKVQSSLGNGSGKEILEYLERLYVRGKLYHDCERKTSYAIGQRDLILELMQISRGKE